MTDFNTTETNNTINTTATSDTINDVLKAVNEKIAKEDAAKLKAAEIKLAAEKKAVAEAREEARLEELQENFHKRKSASQKFAPEKPNMNHQSLFGQVKSSMIHDHYAQIGAIVMEFIINAFSFAYDLIFNPYYHKQKAAFEAAEKETFAYQDEKGEVENFTRAYKKNDHQKYPPIFPIDEETNEPDFNQKPVNENSEDEVTDELIRLNHYQPEATVLQGIEDAFSAQIARAEGPDYLSPRQKMHLYGMAHFDGQHAGSKRRDMALESKLVRNNRPTMVPVKK